MSELEAKKRALVAESEVYREMLKLELHNFRLYALRAKRKLTAFSRPNPMFMLMAPLFGSLVARRRKSWLKRGVMALLSWQFTNRILPYLTGLLSPRAPLEPAHSEEFEPLNR